MRQGAWLLGLVLWAFRYVDANVVQVSSASAEGLLPDKQPIKKFGIRPTVFSLNGGGQFNSNRNRNINRSNNNNNNNSNNKRNKQGEHVEDPSDESNNDNQSTSTSSTSSSSSSSSSRSTMNDPDSDGASVGVKSHSHKRSNAVGDPDGNSSDDDDSDETDSSEWEEFLEEIEELGLAAQSTDNNRNNGHEQEPENTDNNDSSSGPAAAAAAANTGDPLAATADSVQVELEVVEEIDPTTALSSKSSSSSQPNSSGVGVRLANRLSRRTSTTSSTNANDQKTTKSKPSTTTTTSTTTSTSTSRKERRAANEKALIQAWSPFVYLPPTKDGHAYLIDHAKSTETSSKQRLDRRTLYGELLLEWHHQSASSRKFLHPTTSQALQAALSLATQPKWRKSFPQASIIALNDESSTLAMQETVAMALAHSLGCGLVVLDDDVIAAVQQEIRNNPNSPSALHDAKPSSLLKWLLGLAHHGKLGPAAVAAASAASDVSGTSSTLDDNVHHSATAGSIATIMHKELVSGLDDPFDDRAVSSYKDMMEWESTNTQHNDDDGDKDADAATVTKNSAKKPLPLVVFIRTEQSSSLLKSKSIVEHLLQECTSSDSIHLIVLGKGIDIHTDHLPVPHEHDFSSSSDAMTMDQSSSPLDGMSSPSSAMQSSSPYGGMPPQQHHQQQQQAPGMGGPWFGFSPQNQNSSGQNDPEGSRRFNIFLARTTDRNGVPGILGAIASPQAGNLFPQMMALQARERMQQHQEQQQQEQIEGEDGNNSNGNNNQDDVLEQWSKMMQNQHGGNPPFPPPQFFNATLVGPMGGNPFANQQQPPPPEVVQQALQAAMSELLDRLAQMNGSDQDGDDTANSSNNNDNGNDLHPDLHRAFAQVLRNENLRRGIAENLARAAPALMDPKCQGVMLSVYVPPPPHHVNGGKLPGGPASIQSSTSSSSTSSGKQPMGGWFQKILNNHDDEETNDTNDSSSSSSNNNEDPDGKPRSSSKSSKRKDRIRALAAAQAVVTANSSSNNEGESSTDRSETTNNNSNKLEKNLAKLETLCRHIPVKTPVDPVRAKSWESWISRERGAVVFRQNRRALKSELAHRRLLLQQHTGTYGVGSSLRQMLSVRDISDEMEDAIKCAVELEAATSQRQTLSAEEATAKEENAEVDISLHQLLIDDDEFCAIIDGPSDDIAVELPKEKREVASSKHQYLHPSSLERALALTCRLHPSPSGGMTVSSSSQASHRSREDIAALAQDKHERALVSQVVSPQDIGVTYDMIGGLTVVKELLRQSITYPLKFPHLYSEGIAREAVKGVLLFGPPGTGKTMLAKAVATEGGASFLSVDASSVENKWLGESEKNAKAVFTLARRLAPCGIVIDDVDSLLSSREGSSDDSAHGTLTSVKTTMMSEWDGLNSGTNGSGEAGSNRVVVIGSTNRPFDLDEAVLRRFPRRILVDLPDLETRKEILEVTLAENRIDPTVNFTKIAERLEGYTGSDIKEVCREAVVQISHEQAQLADRGALGREGSGIGGVAQVSLERLRPVTIDDFEKALGKLKRSVSERGRELAKVWEWNDEYGEIKREKRDHLPQLMNMFL